MVLGKLDAAASVDFKIPDGMPTSAANVSLALRYMGGGAPAVTVLGHGVVVHSAAVSGGAGGDAYEEYTYLFEYGGAAAIRIRVGSSGGGSGAAAQWALAKVVVMSNVVGAEARQLI